MTLDLDAIKARLEGVTDGPWEYQKDGGKVRRIFQGNGGSQIATVSVFADWQPLEQKKMAHNRADQNARFIAAARTDIPALVAEVERLREYFAAVEAFDGSGIRFDMIERVNRARAALKGTTDD